MGTAPKTYFPPFESLPSAADLEAAQHANDGVVDLRRGLAQSTGRDRPAHQRKQTTLPWATQHKHPK